MNWGMIQWLRSAVRFMIWQIMYVCMRQKGVKIQKASASPKATRAARAFEKLLALGYRLITVIRKNEGTPNKDLERFSRDVQSLCDKWDRTDM